MIGTFPCRFDWGSVQLGTMTDARVARQLGCDIGTVYARRKRLGIPAYGRRKHRHFRDCARCGQTFELRYSTSDQRFCSKQCAYEAEDGTRRRACAHHMEWPDMETLVRTVREVGLTRTARNLGYRYNTLYVYLHRKGIEINPEVL